MDTPPLERVQRAVGDHYEIEGLAGRGGMGAVYRGRHRTLESQVAVKVLPIPAEPGSRELARFEREARLAANLPHPHIVPVFEFQVSDGLAFFIMPFVEGVSLAKHLEAHGRMEPGEVLDLLRQVGSALTFAHERGVVHRDVKPANILRETASGRWLVADFGVARAALGDRTITHSGMVVGTPAYMAPEQAAGAPDVDGRADLYALAAVACEALTGTRTDTLRDAADNMVLLRAARPDVPRGVAHALTRALAFDRHQRPDDVRGWLADVERAAGGRVSGALAAVGPLPRGVRWVALAGAAAVAAAGLFVFLPESDALDARAVAVAPASAAGDALETDLARFFEDELRFLPEQRVHGPAAVSRLLSDRFGTGPRDWSAAAAYLGERLQVGRVLVVEGAAAGAGDSIRATVRLLAVPDGQMLARWSATRPVDSLPALISRIVTEGFAEHAGGGALPGGQEAIRAYREANALFRSGDYEQAVLRYDVVIAADSTFAPAYFHRMLSELLRLRPTQAADGLRTALEAARRWREGLDPVTRDVLGAYEMLVRDGDLQGAHDALKAVVERRSGAEDAWFLLGYVEFYLGALIGVPREAARVPFLRAHALDPAFAAPIAQLAALAVLEDDREAAQTWFARYLAIDSTSAWSDLIRMVDSLEYRGPRAALAAADRMDRRPAAALELLAFSSTQLDVPPALRVLARNAVRELRARATTPEERADAFRLQLSALLGEGRRPEAVSVWQAGRRDLVPPEELDAWAVLTAVTGTAALATPGELARAAERLAARTDDPVALWLAARWHGSRDAARAGAAQRALSRLAERPDATPLAGSLVADLDAHARLAAGDTSGALARWHAATGRYAVAEIPFGLVGSLWPLRLAWTQAAGAAGLHDEAVAASRPFVQPPGANDRIAWELVLPLRAAALEAAGDPLAARELRALHTRATGGGS